MVPEDDIAKVPEDEFDSYGPADMAYDRYYADSMDLMYFEVEGREPDPEAGGGSQSSPPQPVENIFQLRVKVAPPSPMPPPGQVDAIPPTLAPPPQAELLPEPFEEPSQNETTPVVPPQGPAPASSQTSNPVTSDSPPLEASSPPAPTVMPRPPRPSPKPSLFSFQAG